MKKAIQLRAGVHIADGQCPATGTPIPCSGIFIPYDDAGGQAMRDLNRFLVAQGYCDPGEAVPDNILCRDPMDTAIAKMMRAWMRQDNRNHDDQALEERFRERCRDLGRLLRNMRRETAAIRLTISHARARHASARLMAGKQE